MNTIGAFDEEINAYYWINFLAQYVPLIFVAATLIQFFCYFLYNSVVHPFNDLVKADDERTNDIELQPLPKNEVKAKVMVKILEGQELLLTQFQKGQNPEFIPLD